MSAGEADVWRSSLGVAFAAIGAVASAIAIYQFVSGRSSLSSSEHEAASAASVLGEWRYEMDPVGEYNPIVRYQFFEDGTLLVSVRDLPQLGEGFQIVGAAPEEYVPCRFVQEASRVSITCNGRTDVATIAGETLHAYSENADGRITAMTLRRQR